MAPTPQDKWKKKAGFKRRSFNVYDYEYEAFKEACARAGKSISEAIREFIYEFTREEGVQIEPPKK